MKSNGGDAVAAIEPDMRTAWVDPAQARLVSWPMTVKLGRA